jgi:thymidylate synthase
MVLDSTESPNTAGRSDMETFDTLDELWLDAAHKLLGEGEGIASRDGGVAREVLGYSARLADPRACFMFNPIRKISPSYAAAELLWYLSGTNNTTGLQEYAPQYKRFCDDGVHAYGAYGHRMYGFAANYTSLEERETINALTNGPHWRPPGLLETVMAALENKPETRQAVVSLWHPQDLVRAWAGDKKDLPCTLSLQFLLRNGKLNLIVTMRSNDVWLGLPYDAWAWCSIQQLVATALGVELGWYQHQAGSMHVYERNYEKFQQAAWVDNFSTGPIEYTTFYRWNSEIRTALNVEQVIRERKSLCMLDRPFKQTLLGQTCVMAATKWDKLAWEHIENKTLSRYCECL